MQRALILGGALLIFATPVFILGLNSIRSDNRDTTTFLKEYLAANPAGREEIALTYLDFVDATELLDALEQNDPICHTDAHTLGAVIFRKTQNLSQANAVCEKKCSYGCFHGALYEMFFHSPGHANEHFGINLDAATSSADMLRIIVESAPTFCNRPEISQSTIPWSCIHGIGHAVMYGSEYEVGSAIRACEVFKYLQKIHVCLSGAFMEYMSNPAAAEAGGKNLYPCDLYPTYEKICYRFKGRHMIHAWGSIQDALQACQAIEVDASRLACIKGIASWADSPVERLRKPDGYADICGALTVEEQDACIEGALSSVVFNMDVGEIGICATFDPVFQQQCLNAFKAYKSLNFSL